MENKCSHGSVFEYEAPSYYQKEGITEEFILCFKECTNKYCKYKDSQEECPHFIDNEELEEDEIDFRFGKRGKGKMHELISESESKGNSDFHEKTKEEIK